jgi:hypothetical protein
MTMFMLNGQPLPLDTPFIAGDIQYPANWLRLSSPEEKQAIGITEVPDPPPFDDRFYWGPGNPKDLTTLKATWLINVNQIAYTLLVPSDWMVTRKTEIGTAIPTDWSTYRDQVRIDCGLNKDNLNQATDIDSFVAIATNLVWPVAPDAKV